MKRRTAIVLVCASAWPALAGPIATFSVTGSGTGRLVAGEGVRFKPESNTYAPAIFTGGNPAGDGTRTGELTDLTSNGLFDGGIGLASIGLGDSAVEEVPASTYDKEGRVEFTVTDAASGESKSLDLAVGVGGGGYKDDLNAETYVDLDYRGLGAVSWTLGENRYDFDFKTYNSESYTTLYADYRITALDAAVATPEPATVVLAALGLGGVLARRRFRGA